VVQQVRGAQVDRQGLRMLRLGIARELEGALQVGIEIEGPGHHAFVAREDAGGASAGDEKTVGCGDGSGSARQSVLWAVVEDAVAVVVEAGGDVVVGVAAAVKVIAELDLLGKGEGAVAEDVPDGLAGAMRELADVGGGALRAGRVW
jgi:hypothetical protein